MVQPALIDTQLTDLMNEVKASGLMLDRSTFEGRRTYNSIKQSIDKLLTESPSAYYTLRSQLGALCYDVAEVRSAAAGLAALTSFHDGSLVNTVRSLIVVGEYNDAHALFARYSDRMRESDFPVDVMWLAFAGFFASWLVGFGGDVTRMKLTLDKHLQERMDSIYAAAAVDVSEHDVREMLGYAARAFAKSKKHILFTGVSVVEDGLLFELVGRIGSEEAADIEWDYVAMMAEHFPSAPTDRVSISICSYPDDEEVVLPGAVARPDQLS